MRSTFVAYFLWCGGFLFLCGLHRLYCGKYFTGLLWLGTLGLLGMGQILDFFLIPSMVAESNRSSGGGVVVHNHNTNLNTVTVVAGNRRGGKKRRRQSY